MKLKIDRPIQYLVQHWGKQPALAWIISIAWVGLLSLIAFWWHLGSIGLVDETEPLFAEAARQMTVTGDWLTPYFNGETRFDKPPLVYWLMAIAYQTIGVNEWAARFPSALSATVLTLMGFYTLRQFGFPSPGSAMASDRRRFSGLADQQLWLSAWVGATLLALNLQTIAWARTGVSDMLLSGCMGSALLAFFCGYAQPTRHRAQAGWYLAFYVLVALSVLTKGPVGIVLPVLIIGVFLLYTGNVWQVLQEMRLLRGGLLFLLITLPWYILVIWVNGDAYIEAFFGYHNFERFTRVVNHHGAPWYFYFIVVPLGFAPWSAYLPAAIARLHIGRRSHWQQQPRSTHLGLFALTWLIVIFGFFTIAVTKLPSYVLPLMPAAAILVALLWSHQSTRPTLGRGIWLSIIASMGLMVAIAAAILYSPQWIGGDPAMPNLPDVVQQSGLLGRSAGIWLLTAAGLGLLLLLRRGQWAWVATTLGIGLFIVAAVLPAAILMDEQRQLPLRQIASTIVQVQQSDEALMMLGFQKPTLVFYSQRQVFYISDPDNLPARLRRIANQNAQAQSVLIVGYPRKIEDTNLQPNQYEVLQQTGAYELIRVPIPLSSGQ